MSEYIRNQEKGITSTSQSLQSKSTEQLVKTIPQVPKLEKRQTLQTKNYNTIQLSKKTKAPKRLMQVFFDLGNIHYEHKKHAESLKYCLKAYAIAANQNNLNYQEAIASKISPGLSGPSKYTSPLPEVSIHMVWLPSNRLGGPGGKSSQENLLSSQPPSSSIGN